MAFHSHQDEGGEPPFASEPAGSASALTLTDAVSEPERIAGIDVARGIAILGIFLVNIQLFSQAFGIMISTSGPPPGSGPLDKAAWYFVAIFCSGKFYPLFSTLFGIGFMVQLDRAQRAGRAFVPAYLRRLGVLCLLGLAHALLLWYGDILFIYSFAGLILFGTVMIFRNISARALAITGIVLILLASLIATCIGILASSADSDPAATTQTAASEGKDDELASQPSTQANGEATTLPAATQAAQPALEPSTQASAGDGSIAGQFWEALTSGGIRKGPADPIWIDFETRAYREGTWFDAFVFRAISWIAVIVFTLISGFGFHVLGMFFLGASIYRAGLFQRGREHVHRRFVMAGLFVGLPLVLLGVYSPLFAGDIGDVLHGVLDMLGGPLMSLGYLGAATLLAASGAARGLVAAIGRVGRMALTNYLTETVLATFLMYSWGLGWFGSVRSAQQVLIVVSIYVLLLITSTIWLHFFHFGPMEWLWRSLTYLRPQPLLRRSRQSGM